MPGGSGPRIGVRGDTVVCSGRRQELHDETGHFMTPRHPTRRAPLPALRPFSTVSPRTERHGGVLGPKGEAAGVPLAFVGEGLKPSPTARGPAPRCFGPRRDCGRQRDRIRKNAMDRPVCLKIEWREKWRKSAIVREIVIERCYKYRNLDLFRPATPAAANSG